MKNKKLVLFDFFGVICCEISPGWLAMRFEKEKAMTIKNSIVGSADKGEISEREMFERLAKVTGVAPDAILQEWLDIAKIDKDVLAIIDELRGKGYAVGLLSNAPPDFEERLLDRDDLYHYFDAMFISSVRKLAKPDPAFFNLALNEMGYKAEDAIFIDDNPVNIKASINIGIDAILFKNADELRKNLKGILAS